LQAARDFQVPRTGMNDTSAATTGANARQGWRRQTPVLTRVPRVRALRLSPVSEEKP